MSNKITSEVIQRFNEVFQRHDPTALRELVAEDCVIENTNPAPIGEKLFRRIFGDDFDDHLSI